MFFSGIFCIITVLVPEEATSETLIIFLISKSMISASFLIIYPFAGELYPTQVRGVGIGTSSYIGGMGLIVIPFITYLVTQMVPSKRSILKTLISGKREPSPAFGGNGMPISFRRNLRFALARDVKPSFACHSGRRRRIRQRLEHG